MDFKLEIGILRLLCRSFFTIIIILILELALDVLDSELCCCFFCALLLLVAFCRSAYYSAIRICYLQKLHPMFYSIYTCLG